MRWASVPLAFRPHFWAKHSQGVRGTGHFGWNETRGQKNGMGPILFGPIIAKRAARLCFFFGAIR